MWILLDIFFFQKLLSLKNCFKIIKYFRSWTEKRAQEYFVWASYVIYGVKGSNAALEAKLDQILATRGVKISAPPEDVLKKQD